VLVKEATNVGHRCLCIFFEPWVHSSVNHPEMRNSPVSDSNSPQEVGDWGVHEISLEWNRARCPQVTHHDLKSCADERGSRRDKGIVFHLAHGWVFWVEFVFVQFFFQWAKVKKPIPHSTNQPSSDQIPHDNVKHPIKLKCFPRAECCVIVGENIDA